MPDSHDKHKDTVAVFADFLYNPFNNSGKHINKYKQIHCKVPSIVQSSTKDLKSGKYFAASHGKGVADGIAGKAKALVCAKVMNKWSNRIIVQSSNDLSKAAEQLLNKIEMIHISQEEISTRISEVIHWSLIKSEPLCLHRNNIHIATCNYGYTVQAFKHSVGEKVAEFSCKTDERVKLATGGCILFTAVLSIWCV